MIIYILIDSNSKYRFVTKKLHKLGFMWANNKDSLIGRLHYFQEGMRNNKRWGLVIDTELRKTYYGSFPKDINSEEIISEVRNGTFIDIENLENELFLISLKT